jgi:hypothetical protein
LTGGYTDGHIQLYIALLNARIAHIQTADGVKILAEVNDSEAER